MRRDFQPLFELDAAAVPVVRAEAAFTTSPSRRESTPSIASPLPRAQATGVRGASSTLLRCRHHLPTALSPEGFGRLRHRLRPIIRRRAHVGGPAGPDAISSGGLGSCGKLASRTSPRTLPPRPLDGQLSSVAIAASASDGSGR